MGATKVKDEDPWAERPHLPGRNTPKGKVDEFDAMQRLTVEMRDLVRRLLARDEYEVLHGTRQTIFNYRRQGVGGINRDDAHGYISQTLVVGDARARLRALGFGLERMPSPGEAYKDHKWWQVDVARHPGEFEEALQEIERVVDRELERQV